MTKLDGLIAAWVHYMDAAIVAIEAIAAERQSGEIVRCDKCDNGIEADWLYCAWCSAPITPADPAAIYEDTPWRGRAEHHANPGMPILRLSDTWKPANDTAEMSVPEMILHIYRRKSDAVAPNSHTCPFMTVEEWSRIADWVKALGASPLPTAIDPVARVSERGLLSTLKAAGDFIEGLQDRLGATFSRDILKKIDAALAGHERIARTRDDLVLKGLRASCAEVCGFATADVPSSGCNGMCKRELNDWLDEDVRNMRAVVDALEVEHVETDIAMVELLKQARIERDQARIDVAHAHQKLIESNDARQLLANELVSFGAELSALRARPNEGTFAEGIEAAAVKAEENKLYWAAKVDPLSDLPSREIFRAKSAACFQVEMDIRSLTMPEKKGMGE